MGSGYTTLLPRRTAVQEIIADNQGLVSGISGATAKYMGNRYLTWPTPKAPGNTNVLATSVAASSNSVVVLAASSSAPITQPDYPRAVRVAPSTSTLPSGNVVVVGTDQFGKTQTDTIALGGAGVATIDGVVAFKAITSISIPGASSSGSLPVCTVGLSNKFGVDRKAPSVAAAIRGAVNGTAETTAPIINTANNTASFTTAATSSAGALVELLYMHSDIANS